MSVIPATTVPVTTKSTTPIHSKTTRIGKGKLKTTTTESYLINIDKDYQDVAPPVEINMDFPTLYPQNDNPNTYQPNERLSYESEPSLYNELNNAGTGSSGSSGGSGNKIKCFSSLEFGNLTASLDEIIRFNCSMFKKNYSSEFTSGSVYYQCGLDGKFFPLNSTCVYNKLGLLTDLNKRLRNGSQNSLQLMEKLNNELTSYFQANGSIRDIIIFMRNASELIHMDSIVTNTSNLNISNTLFDITDVLIDNQDGWLHMAKSERTKLATILLDIVDKIAYDDYTENFLNPESYLLQSQSDEPQNPYTDFVIENDNLVAELSSNTEFSREIALPKTKNSSEQVLFRLNDPNPKQKFMFISYRNLNEILPAESIELSERVGSTSSREQDIARQLDQSDQASGNNESSPGFVRIINSNIVSLKVNDKNELAYFKENPVELTFAHLEPRPMEDDDDYIVNSYCSYWDYNKETYEGKWSTHGCVTVLSNETHTKCRCNHLTHFAVLMDIYNNQNKIPADHRFILTSLTIVCSAVSCICIILTLLAFRYIKIIKKNREQSATKDLTTITTHLCVCLLASLMVFLFGIVIKELKIKSFCSTIAMASHYLFLSAFFWMLLEGVQLYLMLIRIFLLDKSPIRKFCLIAYGVPFVIVLCSKLFDFYFLDSRGYGTKYSCWLSNEHNFNLTFVVPVSFILLANILILIIVVNGVRNSISSKQSQIIHSQKQQDFLKSLLGFWCLILTLLGIPWILGYAMLDNSHTLIFSYLFTILNSSQGTIIFIFHCIISKNVRDELLKALRKHKRRMLTNGAAGGKHKKRREGGNGGTAMLPGGAGMVNTSSSSGSSKNFIYKASFKNHQADHVNNNYQTNPMIDSRKLLLGYNNLSTRSNNSDQLLSSLNSDSNSPDTTRTLRSRFIYSLEYFFDMLFCFCFRPSSSRSNMMDNNHVNLINSDSSNNNLNNRGNAGGGLLNGNMMILGNNGLINNNSQNINTINNNGKRNSSSFSSSSYSSSSKNTNNTNNNNNKTGSTHFSMDGTNSKTTKQSAILSIDEEEDMDQQMGLHGLYSNNNNNNNNDALAKLLQNHQVIDMAGIYQNHNTLNYQPQQQYMTANRTTNGATVVGNFSVIPLINPTLLRNGAGTTTVHVLNNQLDPNGILRGQLECGQQHSMHYHHDPYCHVHSQPLIMAASHNVMAGGAQQLQQQPVPANTPQSPFSTTFSTFKSPVSTPPSKQQQSIKQSDFITERKAPYSTDENQYLTPECHYHNYSTVDASSRSENGDGEDDDLCNNYVEVIEEFIDDCPAELVTYSNGKAKKELSADVTTSTTTTTTGGEITSSSSSSSSNSPIQASINSSNKLDATMANNNNPNLLLNFNVAGSKTKQSLRRL